MTAQLLERVKKLQEHFLEVGLAQAVLASAAPRMLDMLGAGEDVVGIASIYAKAVSEPEIELVSRDLFASGHYSLAVQETYKAVEKYIQQKTSLTGVSGTPLMQQAFSTSNPKLFWTERKTTSEQDEQKGYLQLYAGAMLGIRNPVAHEFNWIDDPLLSLELILFAQHLLRKAKMAQTSIVD